MCHRIANYWLIVSTLNIDFTVTLADWCFVYSDMLVVCSILSNLTLKCKQQPNDVSMFNHLISNVIFFAIILVWLGNANPFCFKIRIFNKEFLVLSGWSGFYWSFMKINQSTHIILLVWCVLYLC